jgi:hypothetical protein
MAETIAVLTALSNAVALVKKAKTVADSMTNSELKMTIAELMGELANVKMQVVELQEENGQLKKQHDLVGRRVLRNNKYFLNCPPEGYHIGPYCPRFWDEKDKLIALLDYTGPNYELPNFSCPVCKGWYNEKGLV